MSDYHYGLSKLDANENFTYLGQAADQSLSPKSPTLSLMCHAYGK